MTQHEVSFDADTFTDSWVCGGFATLFRENNTKNIRLSCKKIGCPNCWHNVEAARRFRIAFCLEDLLRSPHFFVITSEMNSKKLSNFLQKQVRGAYVCIKQNSGIAVVISTRQFTREKGMRVDKFVLLEKELPIWLQNASCRERAISCSAEVASLGKTMKRRYWRPALKRMLLAGVKTSDVPMLYQFWDTDKDQTGDAVLAAVPGKDKAPHWDSMNELQRAQWMGAQLGQGGKLSKRGRKFILDVVIKAYIAAALAEKAGADLLWRFWVDQILLLPPVENLQD